MSEQDTPETEAPEVEDSTPDEQDAPTPEVDEDSEPDWRKDFDADKAADRIRKLQSEAKNLRERAKSAEKKVGDVDSITKERDDLVVDNLRLSVGYELGLPLALAKRLKGSTREELIEDADELVKIAGGRAPGPRKPVEALRGGGQPEREPEETDVSKLGSRMFSR